MKTTRYFEEQVLRKRPYLRREWLAAILPTRSPASISPMVASAGWGNVEREDGKHYILRVVTLDDGETVHNAFFDRDFKEADA